MAVGLYVSNTGDWPLAEDWNGTRWAVQWVPSPSGAREGNLTSTSYTAVAACTTVGNYKNGSGMVVTPAKRWSSDEWLIDPVHLESVGTTESLLASASCPPATYCTAIGYYENGSGVWASLMER